MRLRFVAAFALLLAVTVHARAQTADAVVSDIAFGRAIAIMRADIATGDELVKRRDWRLAYRHFMFPIEEVYGIVREDLRTYKTPPFDGALKILARTARAGRTKQYPAALKKVQDTLGTAQAGLRGRQSNWPPFVARVAVALLKDAPDEYDDAIVNGRIARPISYQMARSFVREADRMFESVSTELAAKNAEALREIRAHLGLLKTALEPINAPKQPPIELSALSDSVKKIETAAAKL